jgi:serine/threonine-protein kinase RsbT
MAYSSSGELPIRTESDIVAVRKAIRNAAQAIGFTATDSTRIVTAVSELCRNVYKYAGEGKMLWKSLGRNGDAGIEIVFQDNGPGIENIDLAMTPGYTTSKGLGLGLPGAKRLMDEMRLRSDATAGTTIKVIKWKRA